MSAARDLANIGGSTALKIDTSNTRVGIASTIPDTTLDVGGDVLVGTGVTLYASSGIVSATKFYGALVGDITGSVAGTATSATHAMGIKASPSIAVTAITATSGTYSGNISAVDGTFTGNVTVGGTLTSENKTSIDVLGIATYRGDLNVGSTEGGGTGVAITFTKDGNAIFARTGIITATKFVSATDGVAVGVGTTATVITTSQSTQNSFGGVLKEKCSIQATNVTTGSIDLAQGNVHYFTTNGSGNTTADIIYNSGNNVSGFMTTGDNVSVSVISKPNNSEYISAVTIDGAAVTEEWSGGVPSAASGASNTWTVTTINIVRIAGSGTPNTDYLVLCQATNYE